MSVEKLVTLKDVWKTYVMGEVDVHALRGVSLDINRGDFVAIIGASGSGKSTMMNLVGCLDTPTKGIIELKGKDINKLSESSLAVLRGKTIGFVFQQYNLIPTLSAFENVLLPLELQEVNDSISKKQVLKTLDLVGLSDKSHHLPTQLSGGQQQRVSIARCLVANPEIILADEPTGALDSKTGKEILDLLVRLWKDEGKTVIMVTHDLSLAKLANTQIELKDGKIYSIKTNLKVK
ncbi:ABC transporter ATP-binding protein [Candidatus Woesearchaeota archaeon]|nr:ABC transporter ATP-binding protein [Candidatus Woesearchaeota archaeon]